MKPRHQRILVQLAVVCALAGLLQPGLGLAQDPRSGSAFYLDSFGAVDAASYPLAGRVSDVFSKLLRVADRTEYKDPGLLLIDSNDWPWAIALPDNNVVLSRGAVNLCYRDVSPEQGDARLAMILGHELGHLAEDDYWHRDVYLSLSAATEQGTDDVLKFIGERSGLVDASSDQWKSIVRDRELKADDRGFIYAALAGYDTGLLIDSGQNSFFHYWTEQTSAAPGEFHLSADDRAAYLRARSGSLTDIAELYRLGVALVHLGELGLAEKIFKQVLTVFPAHEVYNNLGFIYLQRSLESISLDVDQVFWMPASFDTAPETPGLKTRDLGSALAADDPMKGLDEAGRYFDLAIKKNPGYIAGYLNLATAHFYRQKYNSAAAVLAEARDIVNGPDSGQGDRYAEIESLWQVTMLHSLRGSVDYLPVATDKLQELAASEHVAPSVLFNLAQLHHLAKQDDKAVTQWQRLDQNGYSIPEPFASVSRFRRTGTTEITAAPADDTGLGKLLDVIPHQAPDTQAASLPVSLHNAPLVRTGAAPQSKAGIREYRLNQQPILRINRLPEGVDLTQLDQCCGKPVSRQKTTLGEVRNYGLWVALVEQGEVTEVWQSGLALQ